MAGVDSQIGGSPWPLPDFAGPASPAYLPAYLERPGETARAVAPPIPGSQVQKEIRSMDAPLPATAKEKEAGAADANESSSGAPTDRPSPAFSPFSAIRPFASLAQVEGALTLRVGRVERSRGATPAPHDEFAALADVWNSLAGSVPFRSLEWLAAWWRHYQSPGWQTYLLKVEDTAGQVVGIAPWYLSRSPMAGRVIQFLGSGEVCSEYQTILAKPGCETEVAIAISQWLGHEGARDWDMLLLSAVAADDPATAALAEDFADCGHMVDRRPGMPCWRRELPSTWDEFVQQLSKSRRERLRQLTRKYFDTRRARTRWVENIADLDDAFAMFVDMHQRRRQSLGQPGCYSSRQFADFHAEVSRRLCAQGKLRLLWTELDRRPVGAEYDFIDGRTVYYYSTGVEPDATADHPGWLAMIGSLRRAIDEGCRWFDFLRGDEAYKCSWGARPFATLETRIIARRRLAGLRYQAWLGRQQLRKWGKGIKEWNSRRKATTPKTEQT